MGLGPIILSGQREAESEMKIESCGFFTDGWQQKNI